MVVALFATGMRLISPQTLFFPFVLLLAATALYRGNDNKTRTEEVDAERADYLRYLSVVRDNIRTQAAAQRAAAQWSHPDPTALAAVPGSRRQWERDPHDPDFLVLRAGRHHVPLATALRVNDTADEIDLEPVSHSALRSLLDTQRTVRDVPTGIDLTKVSRITVLGAAGRGAGGAARLGRSGGDLARPDGARGRAGRPRSGEPGLVLAEVVAARRHSRPARRRRAGPLHVHQRRRPGRELLGSALVDRPAFTGEPADALRHLLIVVDDPDFDLNGSTLALGRAGVTVVHRSATAPNREQYSDPEKPILRRQRAAAPSSAGRPAAGSPTSTTPTNSAPTRPRTWRASCPAGTPTRPTPGCARRPPAAPASPRCWASRTPPNWMCPRCGRRAAARTSCAFRSGSPRPVNR